MSAKADRHAAPHGAPAGRARGAPAALRQRAALFDGHDAAINMIRRLLQAHGAEVVHLGHNRSVADIVRGHPGGRRRNRLSSYQGATMNFHYMVDMLRELTPRISASSSAAGHDIPDEIAALERHGVEKIYTPRRPAPRLNGMIDDVFRAGARRAPSGLQLRAAHAPITRTSPRPSPRSSRARATPAGELIPPALARGKRARR